MTRLNPELRRYLWLELSPARLVAMPAVIAVLLLLVGAWAHQPGAPWGGQGLLQAFATFGTVGAALLVLFWGARLAANAVVREVGDRTWDQQRLSSAGAWAMTWGKLFGSTIYVWYGCALLLAVAVVAVVLSDSTYGNVVTGFQIPAGVLVAQMAIGLVAFAVLVMAAVMLAAMTTVARRESGRQLDVSIAQILVILLAFVAVTTVRDQGYGERIVWFGLSLDAAWFSIASLAGFAAWAVIGLWRRMRVELQVASRPVMWPLFVVATGLWCAGFSHGIAAAVVFAVVVLLAGYVPAVLEQLDPVRLRRLFAALGERDLGTALRFMPLWLVNHVVALVAVAAVSVMLLGEGADASGTVAEVDGFGIAAGTLVAAFLFVTRDLLLLVFAWLGRGGRRAFATWLLWMALLYGVVPMILTALGLYASVPAFVPVWDVPFVDLAIPPVLWPLLQVAAALVLLRWRWRRYGARRLATEE